MIDVLRVLARFLMPGSVPFLGIGLAVGLLLLLSPRARWWGRRWLGVLLLLYVVLSLQGTSDLLVAGLSVPHRPIRTAADAPDVRVVVVLSNGAHDVTEGGRRRWVVNALSDFNASEGARVFRALGHPIVIASGGRATGTGTGPPESQALAAALERHGVPAGRIVQDPTSRTTREQAVNVGRLLRDLGQSPFVLVTVPEHMRRAAAAFRAQGLDPIPSPSALRWGGTPFWLPTRSALRGSAGALHEYAALAFYRLEGWI